MFFGSVRGILHAMQAKTPRNVAAAADEAELIRKASVGDRAAFDRLVALHLPQVFATVWRVLRHREDTEDVVQEVFVAAHRSIAGFRGDAKLSTWLHRIAVTRALNHLDKAETKAQRASEPIVYESGGGPRAIGTPLRALEAKELMRRLADCLHKLPAAFRVVLALRDGEANSYEQIAETLHIELGTVRSRLARARGSLKECIEGRAA